MISNAGKNLFKSIIIAIIIFGEVLIYGFTVGGNLTVIFYLIIAVSSFLLILFLFKSLIAKKDIMLIVFIISLVSLLSGGVYTFINNSFDTEIVDSYYSKIIDGPGNSPFESYYWFKDRDGITKCYTEYFTAFDLSNSYEIDDSVYVEEYNGVFNIPHYKLYKQ